MTDTAASFFDASSIGDRGVPVGDVARVAKAVGRSAVVGLGAVAAVGGLLATVTLAAAWLVNSALTRSPIIQTQNFGGPEKLALTAGAPGFMAASTNFETAWARASAGGVPLLPPAAAVADNLVRDVAPARPAAVAAKRPPGAVDFALLSPKSIVARVDGVPLPRPHPEVFGPPAEKFTPQIFKPQVATAAAPPSIVEKRAVQQEAHNKAAPLPGIGERTAVYDISARTVFLPSGERLEAHSGLYDKLDDPRFVNVRMRGATPPNVYDLTLREQLFHGVRAIRLNPIDENKMFGRDGILAHTYMLGPNGQSNGCVSFKNYDRFLNAFLRGEVDRMVVVPSGGTQLALAARARQGRYAAIDPVPGRNQGAW